jgi:hypothetical protein
MEISADNIGKFAFFGCSSLRSATAGNVGQSAFAFCSKMSHVDSLVEVSDGAFWNCENLETVDLSNVKTIGAFSFGRSSLKKAEIKASRVNDFAFCMIQSLESFSILANCCIGYRILYRSDSLKSMSIAGRFKIPSYFGYIPPMLAKVNVEGDICDDFCRSCNSLRSLSISNADHFGRWSFYDCPNLSDVIIENVKTIGDWAFAHCSRLEEIRLPPSVSFIGMNAFRYCNNLRKIRIDSKEAISFGPNALYSTHPDKVIQVSGNLLGDYEKMEIWKDYFHSITGC